MDDRILECAEAAHEVNRAFCKALGDLTQKPWAEASSWQKESAVEGVNRVLSGDTDPSSAHRSWMKSKIDGGWKLGPVKDETKKEHPSLVPFEQLSLWERAKDLLFVTTVEAVATKLGLLP